jgi:endonuclease/exonuclease/phosphatase family metal-dependent hydrolase
VFFALSLCLAYLSTIISPAKIWWLAFYGLAYPYLLIINLVFFVFWLFKLKKAVLISVLAILLGLPQMNNYIPVFGKNKKRESAKDNSLEIKVLSYNVRAFNIYEWLNDPNTKKGIFNFVRSEHPDIICMQEFFTNANSNLDPERIKQIFLETPYQHISYTLKTGNGTGYGIATFSKYPIVNQGAIRFENSTNQTIFTDIVIDRDTIRVYNNHLQSVNFRSNNYSFIDSLSLKYDEKQLREFQDISSKLKRAFIKRAEQASLVSVQIKNSPYPVIVCGDFNDTPVSYTYYKMKKGLYDAFVEAGEGIGSTYFGRMSFRIDYILYSDDFKAIDFEKVETKLSDHYPIMSTLRK